VIIILNVFELISIRTVDDFLSSSFQSLISSFSNFEQLFKYALLQFQISFSLPEFCFDFATNDLFNCHNFKNLHAPLECFISLGWII